jgi:hypothetical protein
MRRVAKQRTFRLVIEAQEMRVTYKPYYLGGNDPYGHFEFRSPHEPPRRIPVSETGYRSHFAPMAEIEAAASPEDYARAVALAIIRREAAAQTEDNSGDQLPLFEMR